MSCKLGLAVSRIMLLMCAKIMVIAHFRHDLQKLSSCEDGISRVVMGHCSKHFPSLPNCTAGSGSPVDVDLQCHRNSDHNKPLAHHHSWPKGRNGPLMVSCEADHKQFKCVPPGTSRGTQSCGSMSGLGEPVCASLFHRLVLFPLRFARILMTSKFQGITLNPPDTRGVSKGLC